MSLSRCFSKILPVFCLSFAFSAPAWCADSQTDTSSASQDASQQPEAQQTPVAQPTTTRQTHKLFAELGYSSYEESTYTAGDTYTGYNVGVDALFNIYNANSSISLVAGPGLNYEETTYDYSGATAYLDSLFLMANAGVAFYIPNTPISIYTLASGGYALYSEQSIEFPGQSYTYSQHDSNYKIGGVVRTMIAVAPKVDVGLGFAYYSDTFTHSDTNKSYTGDNMNADFLVSYSL